MTPERRAAIVALRAAITSPPWEYYPGSYSPDPGYGMVPALLDSHGEQITDLYAVEEADGQFMAEAPAAIDDLLTENAELRALLAQVVRDHSDDCWWWRNMTGCDCGVEADRVQVAGLLAQEGRDDGL